MQWILTSPNLQYAERDRWVLGIPGHLQRCQISSYCGDRYVGSAHICFASTVWCSPPPIPGKLKHLMPTLAFRKGKQVPSDHCCFIESIPVILKLLRSQPFKKLMKSADSVYTPTMRVHATHGQPFPLGTAPSPHTPCTPHPHIPTSPLHFLSPHVLLMSFLSTHRPFCVPFPNFTGTSV